MFDEKKKPNYTRRRLVLGSGLAAVALTGIAVKVGAVTHLSWPDGHEYTQEQLRNFETTQVTVHEGDGAEQIVRTIEPKLVEDRQGFADIREYVTNQGIDTVGGHHRLHSSQTVQVPLVPGIPHSVDK